MSGQLLTAIYGDSNDCWIKYDDAAKFYWRVHFRMGVGIARPHLAMKWTLEL